MNETSVIAPDWLGLRRRLLMFVQARGVAGAEAEDLVHDVLAKALARLPSLREPERVEAWLFQIARHALTDRYRRARPVAQALGDMEIAEEPAESTVEHRLAQCVTRLLETLPASYREAVRAAELEGLTQREVGQRFGLSLSGAKSRVQRGRQMLRERVQACCDVVLDVRGRVVTYTPSCAPSAPCGGCASR